VAAHVLAANPELRWAEVKDVLRRACDPIDPSGGQYDATGHSKFYGHGRLNAETAVKLAKAAVGRQVVVNKLLNEPIPDLGTAEGIIEVADASPVEKLAVSVRLEHTYIGDLVITLVPPPGRGLPSVTLHDRAGGRTRDLDRVYDPSTLPKLAAFAGKPCDGTWTVRVDDRAAEDAGVLVQIGLHLFLAPADGGGDPRRAVRRPVVKNGKPTRRRAKAGR
jgi:subtilisin-like proprotein convertase family protein